MPFSCAVSNYEASYLFPSKYLKYSHALSKPKLARIKPLQQEDRDERSKMAQNIIQSQLKSQCYSQMPRHWACDDHLCELEAVCHGEGRCDVEYETRV